MVWLLDLTTDVMSALVLKLKHWLSIDDISENYNAVTEASSAFKTSLSISYRSRREALSSFSAKPHVEAIPSYFRSWRLALNHRVLSELWDKVWNVSVFFHKS